MKITRLTTYIVPPRWCFLKIETDDRITGWGEPVLEGRAQTVKPIVAADGTKSLPAKPVRKLIPVDAS